MLKEMSNRVSWRKEKHILTEQAQSILTLQIMLPLEHIGVTTQFQITCILTTIPFVSSAICFGRQLMLRNRFFSEAIFALIN